MKACDAIALVLISETCWLMRKTHISSRFRRSMHQARFSYVHTDRKRLFKDRTSWGTASHVIE